MTKNQGYDKKNDILIIPIIKKNIQKVVLELDKKNK